MRSLTSLKAELREVKDELNTHGQHISPLQARILRRRHAKLNRMVKDTTSFHQAMDSSKSQLRLTI